MAKKKDSLKTVSTETLIKDLTDKQNEIQQIRFGKVGKTKNVKVAKQLRKESARILTELNSR